MDKYEVAKEFNAHWPRELIVAADTVAAARGAKRIDVLIEIVSAHPDIKKALKHGS